MQLIADNSWNEADVDFDKLRTAEGIRRIAEYADGIGPWMPHVVSGVDDSGNPVFTSLVADAHALGLQVHCFTFRVDSIPEYARDFEDVLRIFFAADVDGVFTDFPDRAVRFVERDIFSG